MRESFLAVLLVLMLALPLSVLAKEIELSPMPTYGLGTSGHFYSLLPLLPAEQELYNDSGSTAYYWAGTGFAIVNTITIPYDCWLVRMKDYIYGSGTGNVQVDVYSDSGGTPTWTSIIGGVVNIYFSGSQGWFLSSDFSSPIWFNSGTVTHPGQVAGISSAGTCTDSNFSGVGGCWYGSGGSWYGDYTTSFGHVMTRLIVNDDVYPPYADTFDPSDGGTGQPNTTIGFHVRDDTGVDSSSIDFAAQDESKGNVSGTLDIDDSNPLDVVCTFTPDSDLPVGDTITCDIYSGLGDTFGNTTDNDIVWHFTVSPYTKLQSTSLGHIKAQYN